MPQFVSSFIARLLSAAGVSGFDGRRTARLPLSVSLAGLRRAGGGGQQSFPGFTCDLSKAGLSFVVPTVIFGGRHIFCDGDSVLRLGLELPDGTIEMKARPVRYDSAGGDGRGYVVGVNILEIGEADRTSYLRFLRESANSREAASVEMNLRPARVSSGQQGVDRLAPLS